MMTVDLEARIAALPCWRGKVKLEPLHGGLSNTAFVVDDGSERFVARCGDDIPVHHVFRERERAASVAAHAAGLSPELVHAEPGVMVIRHIDGRTLTEADLRANIERIVPLLATCHRELARHLAGPANTFWVFHIIRDYARTLRTARGESDGELSRYVALADALEAQQMPLPIVFGHHDLLPGNFLDDGKRLWLIDWEYGGFGTAMFDLANLAANGSFSPNDDRLLLELYFRKPVSDEVAALVRRDESGQFVARDGLGDGLRDSPRRARRGLSCARRRLPGAHRGGAGAVCRKAREFGRRVMTSRRGKRAPT